MSLLKQQWCMEFLIKHRIGLVFLLVLSAFTLGFVVQWRLSQPSAPESVAQETEGAAPNTAAETTMWTCAMHPHIRQPRPGNCPLCGMKLIPVTSNAGGGLRTLTVSPAARALMSVQTSPVERRYVTAEVRMVGKVDYDETRLKYITAWIPGRLDRLYVDFSGVEVQKGGHLVYIYSEELYSAQDELIQALKYARQRDSQRPFSTEGIDLAESAREKLRLWGLTSEQINEIEQQEKAADHVTIYSPVGGIVIEKLRQEGDRVKVGDRIYTVADLSELWVMLDAYESDLVWLRYGQQVTFTTEAYPGEEFVGRVAFIDPVLNKRTRTVNVRVNVPNTLGKLKPEMFVHGLVRAQIATGGRVMDPSLAGKWIGPMHPEIVKDEPGSCDICGMPLVPAESRGYIAPDLEKTPPPLVIPATAALITGTRAVVYVELPGTDQPTFEGREIVLGPKAGDYYLVRSGLAEGELVVTHGNFKIDSEIQIQAKPSMMTPEGGGGGGGHHHGGAGGKQPQAQSPGNMPGMTIPPEFHAQLRRLESAYEDVSQAVVSADTTQIQATYHALAKAVAEVDGKLLTGHPQMLWKELSMLFTNDAVEGSSAIQPKEVQRVYQLLTRNIQRVREQLGSSPAQHEAPSPKRIDVPAEFQAQLGTLWNSYLGLGDALAGDDLPTARKSVVQLTTALSAFDARQLAGTAQAAWNQKQSKLLKILNSGQSASDLNSLREDFSLLSDELSVLVNTFGLSESTPVYQLHCPMAFDGRGAIWLQKDDQIKNPYLGSVMPK